MAIGYRSMAAFWIGGIATGAAAPEPSCPCPDWTVDRTLLNTFVSDQTLTSTFVQAESLQDMFIHQQTLASTFKQITEQSSNPWRKKNCE